MLACLEPMEVTVEAVIAAIAATMTAMMSMVMMGAVAAPRKGA